MLVWFGFLKKIILYLNIRVAFDMVVVQLINLFVLNQLFVMLLSVVNAVSIFFDLEKAYDTTWVNYERPA